MGASKTLNARMPSSQHAARPRVGEAPIRVELRARGLERVPAGIARGERGGVQERALAPVRAAAERRQRRLDLAEGRLVVNALEEVHGDVGAVAAVGGREQRVVAGAEAQLDRERDRVALEDLARDADAV